MILVSLNKRLAILDEDLTDNSIIEDRFHFENKIVYLLRLVKK